LNPLNSDGRSRLGGNRGTWRCPCGCSCNLSCTHRHPPSLFQPSRKPAGRDFHAPDGDRTSSPPSIVDTRTMVDSLNEDDALSGRENSDQTIVSDSKLVFVRGHQSLEEVRRICCGPLQPRDDPTGDLSIQSVKVKDGCVCPSNRPSRQRPNRFLTWSWAVVRPDLMSSRALRRPTRKASVYVPSSSPRGTSARSLLRSWSYVSRGELFSAASFSRVVGET